MSISKLNEERCECNIIHEDAIEKVRAVMPSIDDMSHLADFFKVFGDTTRVRILSSLSEGEMCVCDIAYLLNMSQSAISHQLRTLKQSRLVKNRKEGKVVYYALDDEHVKQIIAQGLVHIRE